MPTFLQFGVLLPAPRFDLDPLKRAEILKFGEQKVWFAQGTCLNERIKTRDCYDPFATAVPATEGATYRFLMDETDAWAFPMTDRLLQCPLFCVSRLQLAFAFRVRMEP